MPDEVAYALNRCSFFLVFISYRGVSSRNVINEINFAIRKNKPFVAIYIEETTLPLGLELQIANIQAIMKFRMSEKMYRRKMEKTLPAVTKITEEKSGDTVESVDALHSSPKISPQLDTENHSVTKVINKNRVKRSDIIFLSYAIEDKENVEKIMATIENAGLNVFRYKYLTLHMPAAQEKLYFKKIIDNCAIFIPIISKITENRYEGKFRNQWEYAAESASNFKDLTTFILPIIIDDEINIENAKVPEEFHKSEWIHLIGGNLPDEFLYKVKDIINL